jgi:hypothetical protein
MAIGYWLIACFRIAYSHNIFNKDPAGIVTSGSFCFWFIVSYFLFLWCNHQGEGTGVHKEKGL